MEQQGYFKVSEERLIELLAAQAELRDLQYAGVDNWDSGGMIREMFEESCADLGMEQPEDGYWYGYTYEDMAKAMLGQYEKC